ncbi:MAG: hypothetical protein INR71_11450 [Terriglobus roseus]|nr:hypothetical protein [Terriglobus roseus]
MAPSGQTATETAMRTIPVRGVGDYKEPVPAGPKAYNAENETKGSASQPAAKYPNYLPTWDEDKK